ncbi:MAG: EI24 domain-containing protein [Protaetiibacter sp.]
MGERADAARRWPAELARGFASLRHGFAFWRIRPGMMALCLLPALVVALVLGGLVVLLALNLSSIAEWLTPFAEGWWEWARWALRLTVSLAIIAGALVLAGFAFTALTLLIGEPVYERLWRAVEEHLGGMPAERSVGFWRTVGDSARLAIQGVVFGAGVWLLGLVPVVGVVAPVVGFLVASRLVALELTARPLEARGLDRTRRIRMLRSRTPRLLGFGIAVNLCYLLPGGQVAVMPAAVVAATLLAREAHGAAGMPQDSNRPISD